ncbi:MAG TPA: LysE family translocator [Phototrophicaceae bacterium]|nr:LysE family translocator [Phototrophicaceae bacterium]
MPPIANLSLFLAASFVLLLTPGPAVLYIVTRSVDQGRKAGLVSVLGIETGNLFLAIAAAFGLSAILLSSALAFDVVKLLGAAYLIYMGIRKLLTPVQVEAAAVIKERNLRRVFSDGLVVAAFNPKTALFYVAFLPQFVNPAHGSPAVQTLILGLIFSCMAVVTDSCYALLSGTAGSLLKNSVWYKRFQRYVAGSVFIGLGLIAAFSGSGKN